MPRKVLIILGHPSRLRTSFCEALAETYRDAAQKAGHQVDLIKLSSLSFDPVLHEGYTVAQEKEPDIRMAQEKILQAEHLVFIYPMWQFMIPALLKGFMERVFTKDFAFRADAESPLATGLMRGKTARIIQTMGMPGFVYRLFFMAHGAKALKSLLAFCGFTVKATYFGNIEDKSEARHKGYLDAAAALGKAGV